jgi:hypothetical protein
MARYILLSLTAFGLYYASMSLGYSAALLESPKEKVDTLPSWNDVVEFAKKNLPQEGVLIQKADGYVYLKVDDNYIHQLFPLLGLKEEGYQEPPYFRSKDSPGAHISLFNESEQIIPEEIGNSVGFELIKFVIVKPTKDNYYAVLQVEAPALEAIRKKYGLNPKLQGHEYHITLAKKKIRNHP